MKKSSLLFFLLIATCSFAQKATKINGKIVVSDAKPSGVHVINLNTEQEVLSDEMGNFLIEVHADDLLVFSASHLDYMRKIIEQEDIDKGIFTVAMTSNSTMLEEVEITNYSRINAVSLGILSKPAKKYTVAERRLYGATSSPLDGLLNKISGRTDMLNNDIETEKKEFALVSLDGLYPETFYTQTLKIPKEEIGGFHYYIVEDFKLKEALKGDNSFLVTFIMIKLASDYKAIRDAK
ncbi:hypothetical protein [Flavobacterium sp. SM2513]|uniref:hypothetical protein n=1 Tax=Flavobacterium sp. SM2513 TaxID=3424766 RepID=UPI003D7FCD8D